MSLHSVPHGQYKWSMKDRHPFSSIESLLIWEMISMRARVSLRARFLELIYSLSVPGLTSQEEGPAAGNTCSSLKAVMENVNDVGQK